MNLKEYFQAQHGVGILSTADAEGRVDAAVYFRPHVFDDGTVVSERRSPASTKEHHAGGTAD